LDAIAANEIFAEIGVRRDTVDRTTRKRGVASSRIIRDTIVVVIACGGRGRFGSRASGGTQSSQCECERNGERHGLSWLELSWCLGVLRRIGK
jgi:hypothetical protein